MLPLKDASHCLLRLVVILATAFSAIEVTALPAGAQGGGNSPPNYQQLVSAIADLTARVTALESAQSALGGRVSKLESGQITAADIAGTYAWAYMGTELVGSPGRVRNESISGKLTFRTDGVVEFTGTADGCLLQQGAPWTVTCATQEGGASVPVGTWRFQNGTFSLKWGDEDETPLLVGAGARIIAFSSMVTEEYAPGLRFAFSYISVLTKLPNP